MRNKEFDGEHDTLPPAKREGLMRSVWITRSLTSKLSFQAGDSSMQSIHGIEGPLEPGHPTAERLTIRREMLPLPVLTLRLRSIDG